MAKTYERKRSFANVGERRRMRVSIYRVEETRCRMGVEGIRQKENCSCGVASRVAWAGLRWRTETDKGEKSNGAWRDSCACMREADSRVTFFRIRCNALSFKTRSQADMAQLGKTTQQ
ncbi:hypothetical protein TRVL_07173 [Trypanosoma vivax]|nr:hypothetical protein TRVL_07173 [Trypanosoma vivax]